MADAPLERLRAELRELAEPRVRAQQERVLAPADGDELLGVRVPVLRGLARTYRDLTLDEVDSLLRSRVHDERFAGLLVLAEQVRTARGADRGALVDFYLARTGHVDNWDLVDGSAPVVLGPWLLESASDVLDRLAASTSLWERRIAVVATLALIRAGRHEPTFELVLTLRRDPEPLIHKALGWMLREISRHDERALVDFLDRHAPELPRITVRHATERLPPEERARFVKRRREHAPPGGDEQPTAAPTA
ncbi:DNA alkylation repair protein [Actinocorallia populi]|uniref:DNA alkylation repair protein n=1 Tax=Actinocorallia populi TaxID=2079200 RepID=UPI0018E54030|nr:DNA alkylation repair protein [Actinocorallia populi]